MTDSGLVEGYLAFLASNGRRPRTLEAYRMVFARLAEFLVGRPMAQADAGELEAFCGLWLHKRGVVARSRKPYISAVRGLYAWAEKRGHVGSSPAADIRQPRAGKPLPEALSLANAERLMWAPDLNTFMGLRDAVILALLIGCGLRVSGLCALNEGDIRNGQIGDKVRLVVRVTEKGGKTRIVPVPREAEALLRLYLDHDGLREVDREVELAGQPDKVLFVNARNTHVPEHEYRGEAVRLTRQSVWRLIQRYGEQVGVPRAERHPHAFRHLYGTELAEDEVSTTMRGELLGHVDPKTTAIYDSMSMRRKTRIVDESGPLAKIKTPVSELLKRL